MLTKNEFKGDGEFKMKLVIIFGPQAVGKMTVGSELAKITELKLFHNHMSIELFHQFFGYGPETMELAAVVRQVLFEAYAKTEQYGLIFTYVWAFDLQSDWDYLDETCRIFEEQGGEVYFVELEADSDTRLQRNTTPFRLEQKPSKRNFEQSEADLLNTMNTYRLNSLPGEITRRNYIRINNTNIEAAEVALQIKMRFNL